MSAGDQAPATASAAVGSNLSSMVIGTILFTVTVGAWLYASTLHIDTTVLWSVTPPLIGALFVAQPISRAARAATQAAIQTNGTMDERIRAAVHGAMSERDSAYAVPPPSVSPAPQSAPSAPTPGPGNAPANFSRPS